ncbi:MAG: hypothetical protein Q8P80_03895 [Candidatus Levybacteria bacterium]|nr:hypothetical protein [Candidatus Levybacteria bacterium]
MHKAKWIKQLAKYVEDNKEIKGVVWFNTVDNGVDWTIDSSKASTQAFKESFGTYFIQKTP